jgi:hypothetical protein
VNCIATRATAPRRALGGGEVLDAWVQVQEMGYGHGCCHDRHRGRHSTYVALSCHREAATLFYGREDFRADWRRGQVEENFKAVLSRARPKELAHDYLEREPFGDQWLGTPSDRTPEQTPVRERAAEFGQIEREPVALAKSILEVSADLVAARRERARSLGAGSHGAGGAADSDGCGTAEVARGPGRPAPGC